MWNHEERLSKAMTSLILEDKVTSDQNRAKWIRANCRKLYNKYKGIKADGYTAEKLDGIC